MRLMTALETHPGTASHATSVARTARDSHELYVGVLDDVKEDEVRASLAGSSTAAYLAGVPEAYYHDRQYNSNKTALPYRSKVPFTGPTAGTSRPPFKC